MSLMTSLVLTGGSTPEVHVNTYDSDNPIGVVNVDGLTIQASLPSDLLRLGHALLDAADRLSAQRRADVDAFAVTG